MFSLRFYRIYCSTLGVLRFDHFLIAIIGVVPPTDGRPFPSGLVGEKVWELELIIWKQMVLVHNYDIDIFYLN